MQMGQSEGILGLKELGLHCTEMNLMSPHLVQRVESNQGDIGQVQILVNPTNKILHLLCFHFDFRV